MQNEELVLDTECQKHKGLYLLNLSSDVFTAVCVECGKKYSFTPQQWFNLPLNLKFTKENQIRFPKMTEVFNKSGYLECGNEELLTAGREILHHISPLLSIKYPKFQSLNPSGINQLPGYIVPTAGYYNPELTIEKEISNHLESEYHIKFNPEIHIPVTIPVNVVGSGVIAVFELPV